MKSGDQGKDAPVRGQTQAQHVARRLINTHRTEGAAGDTPARAAAAACGQLYRDLSRWIGRDGCHALFTRALAQARNDYPVLAEIQLRPQGEPYVEGVAETIMAHGDAETAEGVESMLVHLVELLGRLIGDDMAMNLIEQSPALYERSNATSHGAREEA